MTASIKAQLAADLLAGEESEQNLPALGFHALRGMDDDRADVTGRVFLGLTVGCAAVPRPQVRPDLDAGFLLAASRFHQQRALGISLSTDEEVQAHKDAKQRVADKKTEFDEFAKAQSDELIDILITETKDYLVAAWRRETAPGLSPSRKIAASTKRRSSDGPITSIKPAANTATSMLGTKPTSTVRRKDGAERLAAEFAGQLLAIHREKRAIDDRNYVKLGGREGARGQKVRLKTNLEFIDPRSGICGRTYARSRFGRTAIRSRVACSTTRPRTSSGS